MSEQKVRKLAIDQIFPNPDQPRKTFSDTHICQLAQSIKDRGLIQPITVTPERTGGGQATKYLIVAGECRWRACQKLGLKTIHAIVKTKASRDDIAVIAIVENLMRADIQPMEEARAFQTMLDRGYTVCKLQTTLGLKTRARIVNRLDLLRLSENHQKLVETGDLNSSMACRIAHLPEPFQTQVVRQIANGQLRTSADVMNAVIAIKTKLDQPNLIGGNKPASQGDCATLTRLEKKVENISRLVAMSFRDNECRAATMVSRDRAAVMIDKLSLIRSGILQMERQLRGALAQNEALN